MKSTYILKKPSSNLHPPTSNLIQLHISALFALSPKQRVPKVPKAWPFAGCAAKIPPRCRNKCRCCHQHTLFRPFRPFRRPIPANSCGPRYTLLASNKTAVGSWTLDPKARKWCHVLIIFETSWDRLIDEVGSVFNLLKSHERHDLTHVSPSASSNRHPCKLGIISRSLAAPSGSTKTLETSKGRNTRPSIYPLLNVYIANWKITMFNGKIHYFYGHVQ